MAKTLTDDDVDAIASRTAECMSAEYKQLWIDRETHYADHTWITYQRARQEEAERFRRKVIHSATIWAVILVAGFVATAVWQAVKTALNG
jgi:hypothetical protein